MNDIDVYTSTGKKFWKHPVQMMNYWLENRNTIISTHISPTAQCNLRCSYCSVAKRNSHEEIPLDVIKQYVSDLVSCGMKAVILTGGGEPTLYPYFNEMVSWLKSQDLEIALITNGTTKDRVDVWDHFSWVRISINDFPMWQDRISVASNVTGTIGFSLVYVGQSISYLQNVQILAKQYGAKYIRILPNCLLDDVRLNKEHEKIDEVLSQFDSSLYLHQYKNHQIPVSTVCHQSYFRPYLSEVNGGTVFPCDSLVLNDNLSFFANRYALCKAENILNYLSHNIMHFFNPKVDCRGCVFSTNIQMLHEWKTLCKNEFNECGKREIEHVNFV